MPTLQRTLGLRDVTFLIVGGVIGSGIFLTPGGVLRDVGGRPELALGVWALGGILSLLGALTYAELTARNPRAGGLYIYIRDAFGPLPAFLFGWTMFFAVASGTVAALAAAFATQAGEFVALGETGSKVLAAAVVVVVTVLNAVSTRGSAEVLNTSTIIKTVFLIGLGVALIALGGEAIFAPDTATAQRLAFEGALESATTAGTALPVEGASLLPTSVITAVGVAMLGVLWSYEGWQYATFAAGEVKDAPRTFPRAIVLGTLLLTAVYLLVNVGYLAALGAGGVMTSDRVASAALEAVGYGTLGKVVIAVILVSIFSCANATLFSATRIFFAMAGDGLFFSRMKEVHPRFQTPMWAILGTGAWALLLALSGTFDQLLAYVVFTGWLFYGLAAAALFVYRKRGIGEDAAYRTPLFPIVPGVFLLLTAGLTLSTILEDPKTALYGLLIVASGVPAYLFWKRAAAPTPVAPTDGGPL